MVGAVGALLAVGFGFSQFSYFTQGAESGQSPVVGTALGFMILGGFVLLLNPTGSLPSSRWRW